MIYALLFLLFNLCATGLYLFSLIRSGKDTGSFEAGQYFKKQGLPASGLERYRLLQEDPDGAAFELIKEAARKKVGESRASRTERILLINGYESEAARRELARNIALVTALASSITFCAGILVTTAAVAVAITALVPPLSLFVWLQILSRQAQQVELRYAQSLAAVLEPLRKVLQQGFDLGTTLETVFKQLPMERDVNPVLIAFQDAVSRSKAGYPIGSCLKDTCRETGIAQMSQLAGLLSLLDQHGAPWKTAFKELQENIQATLRAEAARPRIFRRRA